MQDTRENLEKRIRTTGLVQLGSVLGFSASAACFIGSFAYGVHLDSLSPLSEHIRLEAAQLYTERIADSYLRSAVEQHYSTRLHAIEQTDHYKDEKKYRDLWFSVSDSFAYFTFASLLAWGGSIVYLRHLQKRLEIVGHLELAELEHRERLERLDWS